MKLPLLPREGSGDLFISDFSYLKRWSFLEYTGAFVVLVSGRYDRKIAYVLIMILLILSSYLQVAVVKQFFQLAETDTGWNRMLRAIKIGFAKKAEMMKKPATLLAVKLPISSYTFTFVAGLPAYCQLLLTALATGQALQPDLWETAQQKLWAQSWSMVPVIANIGLPPVLLLLLVLGLVIAALTLLSKLLWLKRTAGTILESRCTITHERRQVVSYLKYLTDYADTVNLVFLSHVTHGAKAEAAIAFDEQATREESDYQPLEPRDAFNVAWWNKCKRCRRNTSEEDKKVINTWSKSEFEARLLAEQNGRHQKFVSRVFLGTALSLWFKVSLMALTYEKLDRLEFSNLLFAILCSLYTIATAIPEQWCFANSFAFSIHGGAFIICILTAMIAFMSAVRLAGVFYCRPTHVFNITSGCVA